MIGMTNRSLAAATVAMGLFVAGCAANGTAGQSSSVASTQAIACSKCQVTWVKVPANNQRGRLVAYTSRKSMICPDCRTAVENFFETGKFEHVCRTCGDSMEICQAH